ncbi:S-layer homology domain-containing protein [Paenibacillus cisolokensis]|uniref:S-layer homology domain-containing protein n=1 Tax=Paenibacillus TaxID=44249 RepID=UPI003D27855A
MEPSASVFADEASVAPWALLNVREAAAIGLVQGRGNHFAPAEPASRAETAQMILNYIRAESSK